MGTWAKSLFGKDSFEDVGIILAGTNSPEFEQQVLGFFDEVVSSKDAVYHGHLVKKDGKYYPLVSNVYGAPAVVDVMTEMHDGGCRNIIFIGYAFGFHDVPVGSVVLPVEAFHFHGLYHAITPDRHVDRPDKELLNKVYDCLRDHIPLHKGVNITVPAVTLQLPHNNPFYKKINPDSLEMEVAALYARAEDIGVRACAVLIISDNRLENIGDDSKRTVRRAAKIKVIERVVARLSSFSLPDLGKEFSINKELARTVALDDNDRTVYDE
ncbi:hypothetical protein GF342_03905 [Candidatus Woesearchaeota archaeon]|nr:hypothetical protein [Candidatus Woesearchaeota archaeon]